MGSTMSEDNQQSELRKLIFQIQNDSSLNTNEKAKKIQELMSSHIIKTIETKNDLPLNWNEKTFHNKDKNQYGCQHYRRDVRILSPCCNKIYTCRLCHDEENDHIMNRHSIKIMVCQHCGEQQSPNQICKKCDQKLSFYFCKICNFWDNTPEKNIYHCDGCGICRIGKGLDIDFKHCDKCNLCLSIGMFDKHRCIENNAKSNCPVCGDYLFTSTKDVTFMRCQHMIHHECLLNLLENSYQCPTCSKTLADVSSHFQILDKYCELPLPEEYQKRRSRVFCCDCEKRSVVKYHFIYNKCGECGSYSTKVLDTFDYTDPGMEEYENLPKPKIYKFKQDELDNEYSAGEYSYELEDDLNEDERTSENNETDNEFDNEFEEEEEDIESNRTETETESDEYITSNEEENN